MLHKQVVDTLARRILTGEYKQNETLPRLESLAEELRTSRTTVREAMRVLASKGFVRSRQRAGTQINPRSHWNLLDHDALAWLLNSDIARDIGDHLLVLRRILEPEAAALAARNASARQLADLESAYERMCASLPDDIDVCCSADVDFHTVLLSASGNLFIEQLAHTMSAGLLITFEYSTRLVDTHIETLSLHGALVDHVRSRDVAAARSAMSALLDKAESDLHPDALSSRVDVPR